MFPCNLVALVSLALVAPSLALPTPAVLPSSSHRAPPLAALRRTLHSLLHPTPLPSPIAVFHTRPHSPPLSPPLRAHTPSARELNLPSSYTPTSMTVNPKLRANDVPGQDQLAFTLPGSLADERTRRAAIAAAVGRAAIEARTFDRRALDEAATADAGSLGEEAFVPLNPERIWSAVDAARHRVVVEARRADGVRKVLEKRAPPKITRGRRHFGAAPLAVGSLH